MVSAALAEGAAPQSAAAHRRIAALFFLSGSAALIYQVAWQRMLLDCFGADIESVTIVVSAFMLGLGAGALCGGELADRMPLRALTLFSLIELSTGAFGYASPTLIHLVGSVAVHGSNAVIAGAIFLLLLLPTTLMGATLPILVTHAVRLHGSGGFCVGTLYFANTLGAATGALLTGFLVLYYLGLSATVYGAATINVAVGVLAWLGLRQRHV